MNLICIFNPVARGIYAMCLALGMVINVTACVDPAAEILHRPDQMVLSTNAIENTEERLFDATLKNTGQMTGFPFELAWPFGFGGEWYCDEMSDVEAVDLLRDALREHFKLNGDQGEKFTISDPYTVCYSSAYETCVCYEIENAGQVDEYKLELINQGDHNPGDNLFESPLFYRTASAPGFHHCVSPAEMQFHHEAMRDLILADMQLPSMNGRKPCKIEVGYDKQGNRVNIYLHSMLVVYGHKIPVETGSEVPGGDNGN